MQKTLHTDMFFRAGVGIILYNKNNQKVLVGKRINTSNCIETWQFPQGGIEHNQTIMDTALTELFEETGIKIHKDCLISTMEGFLTAYEISEVSEKCGRGQVHRWVIFSYDGPAELKNPKDNEFSQLQWMRFPDLLDKEISGPKASIYKEVYKKIKDRGCIII